MRAILLFAWRWPRIEMRVNKSAETRVFCDYFDRFRHLSEHSGVLYCFMKSRLVSCVHYV